MCDPVTGTMLAISAGSKLIEASSAASTARQNARLADKNAAENRALSALDREDQRLKNEYILGGQDVQLAAAGLDLSSASPAELRFASRMATERDMHKAQLHSDVRVNSFRDEAAGHRRDARNVMMKGFIGAVTTFAGNKDFMSGVING